jgi:hypothetical protein
MTRTARSSRRRAGIALGILAALSVLVLIVATTRRSPANTAAPTYVARRRPDAASAAAAGVRFAKLLAVDGVRHRAVFGVRLRSIVAPGYLTRVRLTFGAGAAQVRSLLRGPDHVLRAAPLGYRVDALSSGRASVTVWLVALAGGSRLEPTAQWRALTLNLMWTAAGWRVTDGRGGRGPSPMSPLPVLAAEVSSFHEVRHVP